DDKVAACAGIELLEAWFNKIGTPVNFAQAGIPTDRIEELAADALVTANAWGLGSLWTKERAKEMFAYAL
ncbi:MAG: hypothetical protein WCP73_09585, partial [Eubacteriales bacterium]